MSVSCDWQESQGTAKHLSRALCLVGGRETSPRSLVILKAEGTLAFSQNLRMSQHRLNTDFALSRDRFLQNNRYA